MFMKRERLMQDKDIRFLYSSLTFFYLQGYRENDLNSLFNLSDILQVAKPKFVAMPMSEKDFKDQFSFSLNHPKYTDVMRKVNFSLQTRSEEILNMKGNECNLKIRNSL